ncbi:hypothetical protein KKB28_01635 [bacterium]|nr:hypothetical protein [bacterium]
MKSFLTVLLLSAILPSATLCFSGETQSLYQQTKEHRVDGLKKLDSGPDFRLCWQPMEASQKARPVYLIFMRRSEDMAWSYFDYTDDTSFVDYGAALFFPDIMYDVHVYFGSVRKLPGYPFDPQERRMPGDAFRSVW